MPGHTRDFSAPLLMSHLVIFLYYSLTESGKCKRTIDMNQELETYFRVSDV